MRLWLEVPHRKVSVLHRRGIVRRLEIPQLLLTAACLGLGGWAGYGIISCPSELVVDLQNLLFCLAKPHKVLNVCLLGLFGLFFWRLDKARGIVLFGLLSLEHCCSSA